MGMNRTGRSLASKASLAATAVAALAIAVVVAPSGERAIAGEPIRVTTTVPGTNDDAECSLQEAIHSANYDDDIAPDTIPGTFFDTGCTAGSGADTIVLLPGDAAGATFTMSGPVDDSANHTGPTSTPVVTSPILVDGFGATLVHGGGDSAYRAFAISESGSLHLRDLEIRGFEVQGGDGGGAGGAGGLGAGGAVYVHKGSLIVERSTFVRNGALGGDGSPLSDLYDAAGGGGGGLGGDGGAPDVLAFAGAGGGGGSRGDGGDASDTRTGGGGGTVTGGDGFGKGGFACGGTGGEADTIGGSDADDGHCAGGGGGGGDSESGITVLAGDGGDGQYGGGGGGGGYANGDGGAGGFGGGGGGGPGDGSGGDGGFGGGGGGGAGGAVFGGPGSGGTFAGDGSAEAGGGGAGLGGGIFGHEATIDVVNSTFFNNYANKGHSGGAGANDGRGAGGAIFTAGGMLTVTSSTFNDNQTGQWTSSGESITGLGGGAIVVYDPEGDTEASLLLRNSLLAANGPFPCYTRNGVTTSGSTGNLITDNATNTSGDPACAGVVSTADPGLAPLALNAPGRTRTMAIAANSPAVDAAVAVVSPQIDQRLLLRPQGAGFDIGAYEAATLPPRTTIALTPASPDGTAGWYVTPIGVVIAATDADGTVAATRCALDPSTPPSGFTDLPDAPCAITTITTDGTHALYAASVDADGNTESPAASVTVTLDATAPGLAPALDPSSVVFGQTGASVSPNATDATSGVATASCGEVDASTPGAKTLECTATDNAGNTATTSFGYVVEYRMVGFFQPVPGSRWKAGQTVPVKAALTDAAGVRIPDAEAAALADDCRVQFTVSAAQDLAPVCARYDRAGDQFVTTFRLRKNGTGAATIRMFVTYPGSSLQTQLTTQIEVVR